MFVDHPVRTLLLAALAATTGVLLTGCAKETGRIPVSETTPAERDAAKVLPVALIEFSDQVPQHLCQQLAGTPHIADTPGQVTVILGDLVNKTQIVPSTDFEMASQRLRNNLINSSYARDKLKFVENRARLDRLAAREGVVDQEGMSGPPAYDPQTTYTLNGDFYRVARHDTNSYYMQFQLVHFATNEIVFSDRYEVKQIRK